MLRIHVLRTLAKLSKGVFFFFVLYSDTGIQFSSDAFEFLGLEGNEIDRERKKTKSENLRLPILARAHKPRVRSFNVYFTNTAWTFRLWYVNLRKYTACTN